MSTEEGDPGDPASRRDLIEVIVELDSVLAAAVIDAEGAFETSVGDAGVFRNGEPGSTEPRGEGGEHEDVYLTSIGGDYFLVVAFPARSDFDALETEIQDLLSGHPEDF